jgi:hypothetical protein
MQYAQSQHWDLDHQPWLNWWLGMPQQTQFCPVLILKRQGLSLIAPPTAKKRKTIKKVFIEVNSLALDHKITLY